MPHVESFKSTQVHEHNTLTHTSMSHDKESGLSSSSGTTPSRLRDPLSGFAAEEGCVES